MVKAKTPIKETSYGRDLGSKQACKGKYIPIRDTLDLVGGKWKLRITHALASKPLRFKELQREVEGITARVLSKELKELEVNLLVKREVFATAPVTVTYSLTEYGKTLKPVVMALYKWGEQHRARIMKGNVD